MTDFEVSSLSQAYSAILHHALQLARDALDLKDFEYARCEIEHIHNIPSLQFEENVSRHLYYYDVEREAYLASLAKLDSEQPLKNARLFFQDQWDVIHNSLGNTESDSS